ncbi:hypothetical protein C2845_PM04G24510 [Panicum miliaceum]|uniref:FBD domain-containing protein n=1 Tax=Panicum miliaceum TaxID=4540 RepID=A0A3L6QUC0_PANMI|nr:hypothetical protein C2845_PM04G24510 [Panicum miliaceum]
MLQPENLTVAVAVKAIAPFPVALMLPRLDGTRSLTLDVQGVSLVTPQLILSATVRLRQVVIFATRLKKLAFEARAGVVDDFALLCLAPEVEDLSWQCINRASRVRFGDIWSLTIVTMKTSETKGQLQQSPPSNTLSLGIWERRVVYSLIKRLKLDIHKFQARIRCSANCPCIQLNNWGSQTVSLTHLNEMEIKGVRGEDHDIDILKVILRSAAMLERVTITFKTKSKQRIRRFSSKIQSILKAHPSVKCRMYHCSGEQSVEMLVGSLSTAAVVDQKSGWGLVSLQLILMDPKLPEVPLQLVFMEPKQPERRCSLYLSLDLYCVPKLLASVMLYVRPSIERSKFKLDWDWKKLATILFSLLSSAMSPMLLMATTSSHTREAS